MNLLAAIPVKPFGVAKARLADVLTPQQRARLGTAVAARTAVLARQAGARVVIVTGDHAVAEWAESIGFETLGEGPQAGLDAAATAAARMASDSGLRWAIVHADLPLVTVADLRGVFAAARDGEVLVPSHDGGTTVAAGVGPDFPFSYGPGSFQRHLAAAPDARVITHPRLASDLDTRRDLAHARRVPAGAWLKPFLAGANKDGPSEGL